LESDDSSDAAHGVGDAFLLCGELSLVADVLPWTTPAGAEVGAGRVLAGRRRLDETEQLTQSVIGFFLGNSHFDLVSRRGQRNHDDLPVLAPDAVRAVGEGVDPHKFAVAVIRLDLRVIRHTRHELL
jgi:hypothetical protein